MPRLKPKRSLERWRIITDWDGTIQELEKELVVNEGQMQFEKLEKRISMDEQTIWRDTKAIIMRIKGDSFPTELLISWGHV